MKTKKRYFIQGHTGRPHNFWQYLSQKLSEGQPLEIEAKEYLLSSDKMSDTIIKFKFVDINDKSPNNEFIAKDILSEKWFTITVDASEGIVFISS